MPRLRFGVHIVQDESLRNVNLATALRQVRFQQSSACPRWRARSSKSHSTTRRSGMKTRYLVAPLLLLGACNKGGQVAQRIPADSSQYFRTQVTELTTVAAAKDSLVRDLAETTKLLSDINTEIVKVSNARKPVEPVVG